MNIKKYLMGGLLISLTGYIMAADTVKVTRSTPIFDVGSSNRTSGTSLVTSDSVTNEYTIVMVAPSVAGTPGTSQTITYSRAYLTTPTIIGPAIRPFIDGTIASATLTSSTIVASTTVSAFTVSGINSTTLRGLNFFIYGTQRAGVLE